MSEEYDEQEVDNELPEEEQEYRSPRKSGSGPLRQIFDAFCRFGKSRDSRQTRMDGKTFTKIIRDANLLQRAILTSTDVDLIFARVKPQGQRTLSFKEFKLALKEVAEKKGVESSEIQGAIVRAGPPVGLAVTTPESVRLHDDKSTYTGVYARGGPSFSGSDTKVTLSNLMDRSPYDVRGRKILKTRAKDLVAAERKEAVKRNASPSRRAQKPIPEAPPMERQFEKDLRKTFLAFCRYGEGTSEEGSKRKDLDNAKFAKLVRDSNLLCDQLQTRDIDLFFIKVKDRSQRRINFQQFKVALVMIAEKVEREYGDICELIIQAGGPVTLATQAEYVAFHDDKSTYTGKHAQNPYVR